MSESFPRRAATAILLGPVFVGAVLLGRTPFAVLLGCLLAIGAWELHRVVRCSIGGAARLLPIAVVLLYVLALKGALGVWRDVLAAVGLAGGTLFLFRPWHGAGRGGPERPAPAARGLTAWIGSTVGVIGLGILPAFLILLCAEPEERAVPWGPALLGVFSVWASDTGAYIAGTALGRHRLWPVISPHKTWEGAAGGFLAAAGTAVLLARPLQVGLSWREALLFGAIAGTAAPVGDLIESRMKREAGIKDSGGLFPGHGGVLDRFDSLFFTAPLFYYYLRSIGG